jgi:pyrroline-5-carboxylate reductase
MSTNKTAQNCTQKNSNAHITFIGGGNMGRALISGLLANGFEPNQISVVEANAVTALKLYEDYGLQGIGALMWLRKDWQQNSSMQAHLVH